MGNIFILCHHIWPYKCCHTQSSLILNQQWHEQTVIFSDADYIQCLIEHTSIWSNNMIIIIMGPKKDSMGHLGTHSGWKGLIWVGRLKWSHCWSQMVSFWVAVIKPLPLGPKLVSFWMVWNRRVSNRLTWSQLVLFWVAYRKAPPQRAKMVSFWVVWFPCGQSGLSWSQLVSFWVAFPKPYPHDAHEFTFWGSIPKQGETALFVNAICLVSHELQ